MKTNQLLLIVLTCSFLSIYSAKAQENFKSGYIISNSNDTIRGYLSQVNIDAYTKCSFKKSLTEKTTDYLPGEVLAYRFTDDGKFYISKETPMELGNKILFLEYLIKGKANIYFMRDNVDHYYIETENNPIMELSEKDKIIEGTTYLKPSAYKGKLRFMLANCPELYPEIENTKLFASELIKLAKDYHLKICNTESCIVFERKIKPLKIHTVIVAGVSLDKFGPLVDYSFGGVIGANFEFENLFFSAEQSTIKVGTLIQMNPIYKKNVLGFWYNNKFYDTNTYYTADFGAVNIKIPIKYNYNFLLNKFRPYFGVGIDNLFYITYNSKYTAGILTFNNTRSLPVYHLGFIGTIGSNYKLKNNHFVNMEVNYEITQNLILDEMQRLTNSNFSLLIGYSL